MDHVYFPTSSSNTGSKALVEEEEAEEVWAGLTVTQDDDDYVLPEVLPMPRRRSPSSTPPGSSSTPPGSSSTPPGSSTAPPGSSTAPPVDTTDQYLNMTMARLVNSARYDDCVVTCLAGGVVSWVKAPRSILALALPDFFSALHSRDEQPNLSILAPDFKAADVGRAIEAYLSRGLEPRHIQQLEDEPGGGHDEQDDYDDYGDKRDEGDGDEMDEDDDDEMDEDYLVEEEDEDEEEDGGEEEEPGEMVADLAGLSKPDLPSCSCSPSCESCQRKRKLAERKTREKPYLDSSDRTKRRKKAARVEGIEGWEEARDVVERVARDFPELQEVTSNPCSNLRLMVLVRDLRLSYNQVNLSLPTVSSLSSLLSFTFLSFLSLLSFLSPLSFPPLSLLYLISLPPL